MSNMNQYREEQVATLLPSREVSKKSTSTIPSPFFSVCALLAICGLVAALIPARRAALIDPMQALRTE
jgi:ABC-type antimicrobial peptide transport system permease subunit